MNIAITGSSGLIGSALVSSLEATGHTVRPLSHARPISPSALEAVEAVVHLAGEPIVGRWTPAKKARIRASRTEGTRRLCEAVVGVGQPPRVVVCASAIGFYGNRGTEPLTEASAKGHGFLADVCDEWEKATRLASECGIRVVNVRFGMVLSEKGGALAKLLPVFRLGLGGIVGSGRQFWSWVGLDDVVGAIEHAIICPELRGPVNVVAPNPATNRQFTKALGRVLGRPTVLPLPGVVARLGLGEMAQGLLLASARVRPIRLEGAGYRFQFPELEGALRHLLRKV